jgi:hypothetical protein
MRMEIEIEKGSMAEVLAVLIDKMNIEHITIKLKPTKEPNPKDNE